MTIKVKVASLFDGIGGTLLSTVMCGAEPVWASEIEPAPISITKRHFTQVKHYGNITKINGAEVEPVDIIVGGSPCQDLSVAGKREGLDGERSGLFMDQIRIVKEMRDATGKQTGRGSDELNRPRFMVWENVPGAFSSNKGEDFRVVLEETAKIADEAAVIPRPDKGKWANAGAIMGKGWSIAWRVFDAQFWGVPQRRRRIYLVADFGGQSAPEVLFERESVSGDIAESGETGEETAASIGDGVKKSSYAFISGQSAQARSLGFAEEVSPVIKAVAGGNTIPAVLSVTGTVSPKWAKGTGSPAGDITESGTEGQGVAGDAERSVDTPIWDIGDRRKVADESVGVSPALLSKMGTGGNNVPIVPAYCLQGSMIGRADKNGPQGDGINEDLSFTLNTTDRHAVVTGDAAGSVRTTECYPINDKATRYKGGGATRNKDGSGNGLGIGKDGDPAPTLTSGDKHAVFDARGNGDGSIAAVDYRNGKEDVKDGIKALQILRKDYGNENVFEWAKRVQESIQEANLLRQGVHESGVSEQAQNWNELDDNALPRPELVAGWLVRDMREQQKHRRSPQRREPSKQQENELAKIVPELPQQAAQTSKELFDMWQSGEGLWILREALSAIQKMGKPVCVQGESTHACHSVRRLTPLEAERLQGYPDGYTNIPPQSEVTADDLSFWREVWDEWNDINGKKPKTDKQIIKWLQSEPTDSARYKALGNSFAIPNAFFVISRCVEQLRKAVDAPRQNELTKGCN